MSSSVDLENIWGFVIEYIDSIGQLEILLLLHSQPEKEWTSVAVGEEMRSSEIAAKSQLEQLLSKRLVSKKEEGPSFYRFSPPSEKIRQMIQELAKIYPSYRVKIIALIYDKPNEVLRVFADAFKFQRDD